jgi:hypothetical protein
VTKQLNQSIASPTSFFGSEGELAESEIGRFSADKAAILIGAETPTYDLRSFGAIATDGSASISTVMQSAVDSVSGAGGGIIAIPAGAFLWAEKVVWKSNVKLIGQGAATLINVTTTVGNPAIALEPGTGNTISRIGFAFLRINGDAKTDQVNTSDLDGVFIRGSDSGSITDLHIHDVEINIAVGNPSAGARNSAIMFFGLTGTLRRVVVERVTVISAARHSYAIGFRKKTIGLAVTNCHLDMDQSINLFNALAIYASSNDFRVSGCFAKSRHSSIACSPAHNGVISGNVVVAGWSEPDFPSVEAGIEIEWKNNHQGTETSHDITVSNNIIYGVGTSSDRGILVTDRENGAGTVTTRLSNIVLSGNVVRGIKGASSRAVFMDYCDHSTISGNTIRDVVAGVRIEANTNLIVCDSNSVEGSTTSAFNITGPRKAITNCTVSNCGSSGINARITDFLIVSGFRATGCVTGITLQFAPQNVLMNDIFVFGNMLLGNTTAIDTAGVGLRCVIKDNMGVDLP